MSNQSISYYTIGLMSGSSLDGLDIAYCAFTYSNQWSCKLLHSKSAPLGDWENKLRTAINLNENELSTLSVQFAHYMSKEVKSFIRECAINKIDAVVSHGHTIYHYPEQVRTCQIGDGQTLANLLELKVINNLRQADMDAGGQGAPIVPIGDLHLFKDFPICLNLGGIANLSIKTKEGIFAFDVCTANQVLNHYANKLGLDYDDGGQLARSGKVNAVLLKNLNELEFYQKTGPKSLDNAHAQSLIYRINLVEHNIENVLASFVEHIVYQIRKDIVNYAKQYGIPLNKNLKLLVTGGGALNTFLVEKLKSQINMDLIVPHEDIIDFKEAMIMAFIGVLKLRNEVNVLASATGARKDTSCGEIFEKA